MMSFIVNNKEYKNVIRAKASDSIDEFSGSFSFTTNQKTGIKAGDSCAVNVDGKLFLTGFIDITEISYGDSSHEITFSGRSKTQDIIDSTISDKVEVKGSITLIDAIKKVLETINSPLEVINDNSIGATTYLDGISGKIGDNAFELISTYCRRNKVLLTSNEDGNIVLTDGLAKNSGIKLVNKSGAGNIKKANFSHSLANRFYEYNVKSQLGSGSLLLGGDKTPKNITDQSGSVFDNTIRKTRIMNVVAEKSSNVDQCKERADWMARMNKSRSMTYNATTAFHSREGKQWRKGELVNIDDDFVFELFY